MNSRIIRSFRRDFRTVYQTHSHSSLHAIDGVKEENKVPGSVLSKIAELQDGGARMPGTTIDALRHLSYLDAIASEVLAALGTHPDDEVRWWIAATKREIETHLKDFKTLTSWDMYGQPS